MTVLRTKVSVDNTRQFGTMTIVPHTSTDEVEVRITVPVYTVATCDAWLALCVHEFIHAWARLSGLASNNNTQDEIEVQTSTELAVAAVREYYRKGHEEKDDMDEINNRAATPSESDMSAEATAAANAAFANGAIAMALACESLSLADEARTYSSTERSILTNGHALAGTYIQFLTKVPLKDEQMGRTINASIKSLTLLQSRVKRALVAEGNAR